MRRSGVRFISPAPIQQRKPRYQYGSGVFCFPSDVRADVSKFRECHPAPDKRKAPARGASVGGRCAIAPEGNAAQSTCMNQDETPATPAAFESDDSYAVSNLPITNILGNPATVTLTYSLVKTIQRELEEEARVAKLGFWGRLLYKLSGGPRRYQ